MAGLLSRTLLVFGLTSVLVGLTACSTVNSASESAASWITPYKVEVVQGNFVSKEQMAALRRGMTRDQVQNILGTPLLSSTFHANRWDYVFTIKRQGVAPQKRLLTVYFVNDVLDRFEGDEMPTETEFVDQLDKYKTRKDPQPIAPQAQEAAKAAAPEPVRTPDLAAQAQATIAAAEAAPAPAVAPSPQEAAKAAAPEAVRAPELAAQPQLNMSAAGTESVVAPVRAAIAAPAPVAPEKTAALAPPVVPEVPNRFTEIEPELGQFLSQWLAAAQSRDVAVFTSYYLPEFKGAYSQRDVWVAAQRSRIEKFSSSLSAVRARKLSANSAHLTFRQDDQAPDAKESNLKTLLLVKQDGRWLIQREFSVPLQP